MFDKENWSAQKFSWLYAVAMVIVMVSLAFLLLHFNLIKTINLRFIYIPVIFLGMILFMKDYAKHTGRSINFATAFLRSVRTGMYTCILLAPVILAVLIIGLDKLGIVDQFGRFDEEEYQTGFLFSMFIEISMAVLMGSFLSAFIPGIVQKKK